MSSAKYDVLWSPNNPDRFITTGIDLRLYQVSEVDVKESSPKTETPISDKSIATLLSINNEYQYMKCVSWYPKPEPEHLLAIGQSSGKVVLTSFDHSAEHQTLVGREFVPRHARQCNCVAWNPVEHNLLASGLDKNRADCAILVWDISNPPVQSEYMPEKRHGSLSFTMHADHHHHHAATSTGTYKAQVELGLSEICHSFQWFSHQPKTLVSGMNNKNLKIFDLRDCSKHQNVCTTKAVYGVCVDPYFEYRLSSYIDHQVMVWDIRNFEKPVVTLNELKPVVKLSWSPRRCNLLASLSRESFSLKLYDIQQMSLGSEDIEPTVVERTIQPFGHQILSSFSWHPNHENRLLTISHTNVVRDYTIFDRITLNWAPTSELVWTHGKKLLQCIDNRSSLFENIDDISVKMRLRAQFGYGLPSQQLWQNGEMTQGNPPLSRLWTWLDTVKSLQEEGKISSAQKSDFKYEGVYSIICAPAVDSTNLQAGLTSAFKSEEVHSYWQGLEKNMSLTMTHYRSEERSKALLLCGWDSDFNKDGLTLLLEKLEMDGQYARAAAIAIFNLKLIRAITSLKKGAQVRAEHGGDANFNMVAMAVSGFSDRTNCLWQDMCHSLRLQLQDPYLRAAFTYLLSSLSPLIWS